jgi:DNA-binding transcriptional MerR regulator
MTLYRPSEVAQKLGVSTPTIRRWATAFVDFLSMGANGSLADDGGHFERRYTENDVALLQRASALLGQGYTLTQTRQVLDDEPRPIAKTAAHQIPSSSDSAAAAAMAEVITAQRTTIAALQGQVALLQAEVTRLAAEKDRERARYLGIIRQLLARPPGRE